ncbi:unnamed protein product, partial [Pylaiella littoralis]
MVGDDFTSESDDEEAEEAATRAREGHDLSSQQQEQQQQRSWLSFSTKVAEAGAGVMASKAGRLKQKALSVVDTVQTLSSHNSSNSCTITVKSSPPRTAAEMTKLSVRRGWMLKRNEQRAWQRRYCCLVPHTFLYYFESKDAEAPRGVIDLDPYTDIGVDQATGSIVLGPGSGDAAKQGLRKYYLRPEDRRTGAASTGGGGGGGGLEGRGAAGSPGGGGGNQNAGDDAEEYLVPVGGGGCEDGGDALGEWLSGLHRDRYKVVRDERDAYMNLQEEYMAQMEDTTSAMTEKECERGRVLQGLRAEHAAARAAARDGLEQARALFREEELPAEDSSSLPLPALLARVRAVAFERRSGQKRLESELAAALAALERARGSERASRGITERLRGEAAEASARATNAEARVTRAEAEATRERGVRAVVEASLVACRTRLETALVDADQGQVNLGIMAGERRSAVAKAAELSEQKRLLVREVKASRRSLAEASSVNRRLARAYESLERSLRSSPSPSSSSPPPANPPVAVAATAVAAAAPATPDANLHPRSPADHTTTVDATTAAAAAAAAAAAEVSSSSPLRTATTTTTPYQSPAAAAAAASAAAPGAKVVTPAEGATTTAVAASGGGSGSGSSSGNGNGVRSGGGGGGGGGACATPPSVARRVEVAAAAPMSPAAGALFSGEGGWRQARTVSSPAGDGANTAAGGGGVAGGGHRRRISSATQIQVRNLSTGDVSVLDTSAEMMSRGRASSTEGGSSKEDRPLTTTAWEPHSSNLGLRITQTLASASWPWAPKSGAGVPAGASSAAAAGSGSWAGEEAGVAPNPPQSVPASGTAVDAATSGRSGGPGDEPGKAATSSVGGARVGSGDDGDARVADRELVVATDAGSDRSGEIGTENGAGSGSSYSAFVGALESVVSSMGSSRGSLRSRLGTGVTPSLFLDERDDDCDGDGNYGVGGGGVDVINGALSAASASSLPCKDVVSSGASFAPALGADCGGGVGGGGSVLSDAADEVRCHSGDAGAAGGSDDDGGEEAFAATSGIGALVCIRCRGTVEGPQHSTCTCEVPELNSEQIERAGNQTADGLSRLKGVFKSFNGGVEVARQILDSAVRQNVANNMPPRPRRRPSTPGSGRYQSPASSMHSDPGDRYPSPASSTHGDTAAAAAAAIPDVDGVDCATVGGGGGGGEVNGTPADKPAAAPEVREEEEEEEEEKEVGEHERNQSSSQSAGCLDRDAVVAADENPGSDLKSAPGEGAGTTPEAGTLTLDGVSDVPAACAASSISAEEEGGDKKAEREEKKDGMREEGERNQSSRSGGSRVREAVVGDDDSAGGEDLDSALGEDKGTTSGLNVASPDAVAVDIAGVGVAPTTAVAAAETQGEASRPRGEEEEEKEGEKEVEEEEKEEEEERGLDKESLQQPSQTAFGEIGSGQGDEGNNPRNIEDASPAPTLSPSPPTQPPPPPPPPPPSASETAAVPEEADADSLDGDVPACGSLSTDAATSTGVPESDIVRHVRDGGSEAKQDRADNEADRTEEAGSNGEAELLPGGERATEGRDRGTQEGDEGQEEVEVGVGGQEGRGDEEQAGSPPARSEGRDRGAQEGDDGQ